MKIDDSKLVEGLTMASEAIFNFKPRTITRPPGRLLAPRLNTIRLFGMSLRSFEDNGGAQPAGAVPHRGRDKAKAEARKQAIAKLPKALPLKQRKKLLARKLAMRRARDS